MPVRSLTQQLAGLLQRPIADADRRLAAMHVEDWIGAVVAALTTAEGRALSTYTRAQRGTGATAIGVGDATEAGAAFHNASLAIALELDSNDRQAKLHPGPVVIAAALAAAEASAASGQTFLDAVVRGYEAAIRVGRSVGPQHYHFFHNTSTCGGFGAAAAVATVVGLDEDTLSHALGLAGTTAGGFWQVRLEEASAKLVHAGRAAESGVTAARLAAAGITGPLRILEGELGLYAATAPDADPSAVTAGPQLPWLVHETSLKPWACCRHAHAAIDATLRLRPQLTTGEAITQIDVATYADAIAFCDLPEPVTSGQARFSLQHVVATAIVDGEVGLGAFAASSLGRGEAAALRSLVRLHTDPELEGRYPSSWGARVTVTTKSGKMTSGCRDTKGDPENPMTLDDVRRKTHDLLLAWHDDPAYPTGLSGALDRIADDAPVSELTTVLRQVSRPPDATYQS